jgi:acyl carrier protein
MELQERLNQIFCEVFEDDDIKIAPDTTADDIDGWDSLSHVNLITAVEAKLNIRFTKKELLKQRNVGDLIEDINRKLAV